MKSAFARYVLNKQLGAVALLNPADVGRTQTDVIFNDSAWAALLQCIPVLILKQSGLTMVTL